MSTASRSTRASSPAPSIQDPQRDGGSSHHHRNGPRPQHACSGRRRRDARPKRLPDAPPLRRRAGLSLRPPDAEERSICHGTAHRSRTSASASQPKLCLSQSSTSPSKPPFSSETECAAKLWRTSSRTLRLRYSYPGHNCPRHSHSTDSNGHSQKPDRQHIALSFACCCMLSFGGFVLMKRGWFVLLLVVGFAAPAVSHAQVSAYGEFTASKLLNGPQGDFLYGATTGIIVDGPKVKRMLISADIQGRFVGKGGEASGRRHHRPTLCI